MLKIIMMFIGGVAATAVGLFLLGTLSYIVSLMWHYGRLSGQAYFLRSNPDTMLLFTTPKQHREPE